MPDFRELRIGFCQSLERVKTPRDADELLELLETCADNTRMLRERLSHEDKTPTLPSIPLGS